MDVHTGKLGLGLTLAIPDAFATELGLEENALVDISFHGSAIIVRQANQSPAQPEDSLARATEANRHSEVETMEFMRDAEMMEALRRGIRDFQEGNHVSPDEAKAKLNIED